MNKHGKQVHPEALYYHIANEAFKSALVEMDEFERKKQLVISLLFSVTCLETFINQAYDAQPETEKILEEGKGMSLETKWLMLPLLLGTEETFSKGTPPFQTFHELIYIRNEKLVHFTQATERKSEGKTSHKGPYEDLIADADRVEKYVHCIETMIRELNRLTNGSIEIPPFLTGSKYLSTIVKDFTIPVTWSAS